MDDPVSSDAVRTAGARGLIIVRGEELRGRIKAIPGFWQVAMEADIDIVASVTVDGRKGRLLGKTVEGSADGEAQAGGACEGGSDAVAAAAATLIKI